MTTAVNMEPQETQNIAAHSGFAEHVPPLDVLNKSETRSEMLSAESLLRARVPVNACYTISSAPGKGLGLFATKEIAPGEMILSDVALMTLPEDMVDEENILAAYEDLNDPDKALFEEMCMPFVALEAAFNYHKFSNYIGAYDHTICGFQPLAAMINHSCRPNAAMISRGSDFAIRVRATRAIKKGEEVVVDYLPVLPFLGREDRQTTLERMSGFRCQCDACTTPDAGSDSRRRLASGLLWLACPQLADDLEGLIVGSKGGFGRAQVLDADLQKRRDLDKLTVAETRMHAQGLLTLLDDEGVIEPIAAQILLLCSRKYLEGAESGEVDCDLTSTTAAIGDMIRCIEILNTCCGLETRLGVVAFETCGSLLKLVGEQASIVQLCKSHDYS